MNPPSETYPIFHSWVQEHRHSDRGSSYLFAPMVEFNVMSEVGDTPP